MAYAKKIEELISSKGIEVGDEIEVIRKDGTKLRGILMPRIDLGDKEAIVIKLDNGYNVGVKLQEGDEVKLVSKGKPIEFESMEIEGGISGEKPCVSILGCGGTIASRVEYKTGAVFPAFSPGDLLFSFPRLKEVAEIRGRKLFDLLSEDMTPQHWKIIAEEVVKEIEEGVDGVVLMHGTDTMHYTSAALSFMLQNLPVPVVLVGAQRSSDRGSSDNEMNLLSSVFFAANSEVAEVCVCMHASSSDDFCYVHQGTKVRKMHTSRRDAFRSINVLPYAKVWYLERKVEYLRKDFRVRDKGRKVKVDTELNPNVGIVYFHPGMKPEILERYAEVYDGIVIAATGLGHVATNPFEDKFAQSLLPTIKSIIASGVPVVLAPQTIYGRLNFNVYTTGRLLKEAGVIGHLCDWTPEVAMVKLMWVLGKTRDMKKIKELMETNVAGEISESSVYDGFLV